MEHVNWPKPGTYLLAVSGGVDSVVLLDVFTTFSQDKKYHLYVAHFDHGMRPDSADDEAFVAELAATYGFQYVTATPEAKLTSEAAARTARYDFLRIMAERFGAKIVTAHHQDDLVETSILNLTRGTGRTGLVPFTATTVLRPFRDTARADILAYAKSHQLTWREDLTNADLTNPRNFLRHRLMSQADPSWRKEYSARIDQLSRDNAEIDAILDTHINVQADTVKLPRNLIMALSQTELAELLTRIIRRLDPSLELSTRVIAEVVVFAKAATPGQSRPIRSDIGMFVQRDIFTIGNIVKNAARRRNN